MNLQSFLTPIAEFLVMIFDSILVPISDAFNWVCIVMAIFGILAWLKTQADFNKAARENGTIM